MASSFLYAAEEAASVSSLPAAFTQLWMNFVGIIAAGGSQ